MSEVSIRHKKTTSYFLGGEEEISAAKLPLSLVCKTK